MISTGLPTSRRARAMRWASESTTRPAPTASIPNSQARTQTDSLGTCPTANRPSIATAMAATETRAHDGHDAVQHQRAQPRAIEPAQAEQQHDQRRQRQQRRA